MISRALGLIICLFSLILPWKARVLFSEILGWITQFIYYTYFGILNYLIREIKKSKEDKSKDYE